MRGFKITLIITVSFSVRVINVFVFRGIRCKYCCIPFTTPKRWGTV